MAQYSYPYLCGHGHGTVRLYGKESDRQRKLAWYADTFVCPDCFKKQKAEEDAAAPKTASLHLAVYGDVYQSRQVPGQLTANKEALKQLGYRWNDEMDGGLLALFKKPKLALQKWTVVRNIEEIQNTAKQWAEQYWNGKFYGDDKRGWRIYLDGEPLKVANGDKASYEKWRADLKDWQDFWKD